MPTSNQTQEQVDIAIVGGGPAALFCFRECVNKLAPRSILVVERGESLGRGMPYSRFGSLKEHSANVSSDELAELEESLVDWLRNQSDEYLGQFDIDPNTLHEKEVVPRLVLGDYLETQFDLVIKRAQSNGFSIFIEHHNVDDIVPEAHSVLIHIGNKTMRAKKLIIATGHAWPHDKEQKVDGWFDSPYPPTKLTGVVNKSVCLRGSSLTAVDAIKTLARANGEFVGSDSETKYRKKSDCPNFHIDMHSRNGLLPAVRVHFDDPYMSKNSMLSESAIAENIRDNNGFLSLDFLFEKGYKAAIKRSDPGLYEQISTLNLEQFVEKMFTYRLESEPFELLQREYDKSLRSIKTETSVPWKELLSGLSIELNYPAKHMSAEDLLRLKKTLAPLISTVIAFLPQKSAEELLALHQSGCLDLIDDGGPGEAVSLDGRIEFNWKDGTKKKCYEAFVDCVGQRPLGPSEFPFKSLIESRVLSEAHVRFKDSVEARKAADDGADVFSKGNDFFLRVPGFNITDSFQAVSEDGAASDNVFLMTVPFIGGLNPDYSGLDFCDNAAKMIVRYLETKTETPSDQASNRETHKASEPAA